MDLFVSLLNSVSLNHQALKSTIIDQTVSFSLDDLALITPGWLHLNSCDNFSFLYMSPKMQEETGFRFSLESTEVDQIYWNYLHPATRRNIIKSWRELSKSQNNETFTTIFQQIKLQENNYEWFIINSKYYGNMECILSVTNPLKNLKDFKYSFGKILDDTHFLKENLYKYDLLTIREKEIVSLMVQDYTMNDVAEKLFISEFTAKTHRKNIYRKLEISNLCELIHFAYLYGII